MKENLVPQSPFAKYSGTLQLGAQPIDCYVLDRGMPRFDGRNCD